VLVAVAMAAGPSIIADGELAGREQGPGNSSSARHGRTARRGLADGARINRSSEASARPVSRIGRRMAIAGGDSISGGLLQTGDGELDEVSALCTRHFAIGDSNANIS